MGHYCDMRGFLSFLVLRLISQKDRSGEDLRAEIAKRKGARPSPGTIYPVLKGLRRAGLISEIKGSKKVKVYAITRKGRQELDFAMERFMAIFCDMKEEFKRS